MFITSKVIYHRGASLSEHAFADLSHGIQTMDNSRICHCRCFEYGKQKPSCSHFSGQGSYYATHEGLITEKFPYEISKSWDFAKDFQISGKILRFHERFQDFSQDFKILLRFQDFT